MQHYEIKTSIRIYVGLVDAVPLPKIPGNRLDILACILIALDYVWDISDKILGLRKNIGMCQKTPFFSTFTA